MVYILYGARFNICQSKNKDISSPRDQVLGKNEIRILRQELLFKLQSKYLTTTFKEFKNSISTVKHIEKRPKICFGNREFKRRRK